MTALNGGRTQGQKKRTAASQSCFIRQIYIYLVHMKQQSRVLFASTCAQFRIELPFNVGLNAGDKMLKGFNVKRTFHEWNQTQHPAMIRRADRGQDNRNSNSYLSNR